MSDSMLPPVVVELSGTVAPFTKAVTAAVTSLERLSKAASSAAESVERAFAMMREGVGALEGITEAANAAKASLQGMSRAANAVAKATDKAGLATEASMSGIAGAAERMAEAVDTSVRVVETNMTSLGVETRVIAADMREAGAATAVAGREMGVAGAESEGLGAKMLGLGEASRMLKAVLPLTFVAVAYEAVKAASSFQSVTTRLVTSAGEQESALGGVRKGLLSMAGQVGVSADDLAKALYYVNAAGYHAADGLTVLRAAAQGAAAEGADTTTVAKALTDVLVDYHMPASAAADATSKMVTAISHGKTNLQDFSGAFASIVPAASAAGISFNDVGSLLATMTNHGFTAQRAAQNLAQALRSLVNPTTPMKKAFDEFGVSTATLKDKLSGPNGLSDAMEYLSQQAAKAGKLGTPAYAAALKRLMGTAAGANAALSTTGENIGATNATIKAMAGTTADASGKVQGFALVQQTLGQQLKQVKAGFDAILIRLGDALIPQLSKFISYVGSTAGPIVSKFGTILSQIASGFDKVGKSAKAVAKPIAAIMAPFTTAKAIALGGTERVLGQSQPTVAQLPGGERPILPAASAAIAQSVAQMAPPPSMTAWEKVGAKLRGIVADMGKTIGEIVKIIKNLWTALSPVAALLAGALLGAIKAVAGFLSGFLGPALVAVSGFLAQHTGLVKILVIAFVAWKVAAAATAIQMAILNAITDANPFSLIVLGIAALVLGLVMLWQHCETARIIIATVFAAIATVILTEVQVVLLVVKALADGVLGAAYGVVKALSYIPGPTQKAMKTAAAGIEGFRNDSDRFFNGAIKNVTNWRNAALNMPTEIKLQGNITDLQSKLKDAQNQLKTVPPSQRVAVQANIDQLKQQITAAQQSLAKLQGKTINVTVAYHTTGNQAVSTTGYTYANGGIHYAASGLINRQAGMAQGGSNIMWAEDSTGGESYIPHALNKRSRSRQIAEETVKILGGQVQWAGAAGGGSALGPLGDFTRLGAAIPQGIAAGVGQNSAQAHAAVLGLATGAVQVFSTELGIASPSKKFAALGAYVIYGLVQGMTGSTASVKAATKRISSALYVDFGKSHQALQRGINKENQAMLGLAAKRDSVVARLKTANATLATLQKDWAAEQKSVADSIMQNASVVMAAPSDGTTLTSFQVVDNMRKEMQATVQFAADLRAAQKKGLSAAMVQQIASAGVASGGATAAALANATKGQIQQLNAMQGTMQGAANGVGGAVADSMYATGIAAAKGLIKGLQAQQKAIDAQMLAIAKSMQSAIKKALGIKSPSKVFSDLGEFIPQGLAKGIAIGTPHATGAVMTMSAAVAGAGGSRNVGYARSGAGGTTVVYNVQVTVQGTVTSENNLVNAIETGLLKKGMRRSTTYTPYRR